MMTILEEKDRIRDLLANYCFFTDACLTDKWVGLFTEDCVWDGGPFGFCDSRAALQAFSEKNGRNGFGLKHNNTNIVIEVDGDEAYARSYVVVYRSTESGAQAMFAGHYFDQLVKREGCWLFQTRQLRQDLADMPARPR